MRSKIIIAAVAAAFGGFAFASSALAAPSTNPHACGEKTQTVDKGDYKDIVDIAANAGQFNTLVTAVKAAGLVDTLKGDGPFTVFAPSDEAFAKLPKGTVEALLKDKEKLRAILTYHVVPGKVMARDAMRLDKAKTVNGQELRISKKDGAVMVDGARVVATDIKASNGVIHVIDAVVLPGKRSAQR